MDVLVILSTSLTAQLTQQGIKHNPANIVQIGKNADGKIMFLESGNSGAGLQHIVQRHGADFANRGISQSQIPQAVMAAVTRGKVVGYQGKGTGRPIYEVGFGGQTHRMAVTTGSNGFIVGTNPKKKDGRKKTGQPYLLCFSSSPLLTFKLPQLSFVQDNDYDFSSKNPYRCRIDSVLSHNKSLC